MRTVVMWLVAAGCLVGCDATAGHSISPGDLSSVTPTASAPRLPLHPVRVPGLASFSVMDLSFVSARHGWILGSGDCSPALATVAAPCAALAVTTDGGRSWSRANPPPAHVLGSRGCFVPCVEHVRFAAGGVGYVYGRSSLFMTTDGGAHWTRKPGHADALTMVGSTVIRVSARYSPPAATYQIQLAAVGSESWRSSAIPFRLVGDAAAAVAVGGHAYVELYGNPAAGAGSALSTLFISADSGRSWSRRREPCPQVGGGAAGKEVDSVAMVAARDGSLTLLCQPRGGTATPFTVTSTNNGLSFHAPSAPLPDTTVGMAALSARTIFGCGEQIDRSTDGGHSWKPVVQDAGGAECTIAFPNATTGYWIAPTSQTIWTTHTGGRTWSPFTFG